MAGPKHTLVLFPASHAAMVTWAEKQFDAMVESHTIQHGADFREMPHVQNPSGQCKDHHSMGIGRPEAQLKD